jgi:uncharacterized protein involved in exopolysaccharide biosynthesis
VTASTNGRRSTRMARPTNGSHVRSETPMPSRAGLPDGGRGGKAGSVAGPNSPPRRRLSNRQWAWLTALLLVLTALGGGAGYLTASQLPTLYAARADVLYSLTREQPTGFLREDRNLSTQLVLLESRTVLEPVSVEWDMSVGDLTDAFDATVVSESEVIEVSLTDEDPARAEGLLDAILARYLQVSNNDDRAEVRDYLDEQLRDVLTLILMLRSAPQGREGELAALVQREQWLRTQLDELRFSDLAGPSAQVLVDPYVDADPVSPRPGITTAAGAASGLLVALFVVALLSRRMTRPHPGP